MTDPKQADLVFEGGGVKGVGLAGAFKTLDDEGWKVMRAAGTSAGAITAALVAAGYRGADLEKTVLEDMDFRRFADGRGGLVQEAFELLHESGLHSGDYFLKWIRGLLEEKGIARFGDLRTGESEDDPARRYRLQVIASDLSTRRLLILPRHAHWLGLDPDDLRVAEAVRMSMSIPIFFAPWRQRTGSGVHTIVDGGLLSNFPVWLFDAPPGQAPRWPTFGLLLVAPNQREPLVGEARQSSDVSLAPLEYLSAIAHTMLEAHDRLYLEQDQFARTITIDALGVGTTQFDIDEGLKRRLFKSGSDAAADFLRHWDFDDYKRTFRQGAPATSRRQRVVDRMRGGG